MAKKATGRGVLETHHDAICNVLSVSKTTLISLTGKLFSKHIIDRRTKTSVVSKGGYKGADILLDHVEMKVESKPHILQIVLKAMKEHESLVDIVEQMENWEGEDTQISDYPETNVKVDKLDPVAEAEKLKQQFEELLLFILKSIGGVDLSVLKFQISMFFQCETISSPEIRAISDTLQSMITPQDVLNFLIMGKYVGYLNFELIKAFQKVMKSDQLEKKIEEYEKNHIAFLKLFSFNAILNAFKQHPDLAPASVIGLPKFKVRLQTPWDGRSVFQWVEFFQEVSTSSTWPSSLIIDSIERNCIVLTYAVLPCFISSVFKDLEDPLLKKQLENEGVSIELSSDLLQLGTEDEEYTTRKQSVTQLQRQSDRFYTNPSNLIPAPSNTSSSTNYTVGSRPMECSSVCKLCFRRFPTMSTYPNLKEARRFSTTEHRNCPRVLVTEFDNDLVEIRPFPHRRPSGIRNFRMCSNGNQCTRLPNCTYAHSRAEKREWNRQLENERDANSKRSVTQQQRQSDRFYTNPSSFIPGPSNTSSSSRYGISSVTKYPPEHPQTMMDSHTSNEKFQPAPTTVTKSTYQERKSHPPCLEDTKLPVTVENYRKKYNALLFYEEEEHIRLLANNCNGQYIISREDKIDNESFPFCASIHGMSPNQILYALQASGEVYIASPPHSIKAYNLSSNYSYSKDCLCIGLKGYNAWTLEAAMRRGIFQFDVRFEVNHSYFNSLHYSVDKISDEALKRIVPHDDDFKDGLDLSSIPRSKYSVHIFDDIQVKALRTMVFSQSTAPVLIPGPFGSGKTRLLSVATEYFIESAKEKDYPSRVLLCCHHQDSADIFMKQYFFPVLKDQENPWNVDVVRVTSQAHSKRKLRYCMSFSEFEEMKDIYLSKPYLVIVTTFLTALRMSDFIPPNFFTHILIDEGAQAREPECIAPLCMANKSTRIVIVGDSKQVGPKLLVLGKIPVENGLGDSLLERLHTTYQKSGDTAKKYAVTLRNNYRCHADLLKLSSDLFYQASLKSCGKIDVVAPYTLRFICSSLDTNPASFSDNEIEAKIIIREVEKLLCTNKKINANNVCIMSPSQRQMSLIRRYLWQMYRPNSDMTKVRVLSSYQMQGKEFQVLFLSTVECVLSSGKPFDPLKSLCHPAVFNTAITRAQSLVVAVGNPFTLRKAETTMENPKRCWKKFISTCRNRETYDESSYLEFTGQHPISGVSKTDDVLPVLTTTSHELPKVKPKTIKDDITVRTSSVRHDGTSWLRTARNNEIKQPFQPPVPIQRNLLVTGKLDEPKQQLPTPKKPQLQSTKQQQSQLVYLPEGSKQQLLKPSESKPMPVKEEQQQMTTKTYGAQKTTVSTKHEKTNRELQSTKLKQHAEVQAIVSKSVSQQVIPDKISQNKPISSDQRVVTRPKMHNQSRHDVPKQPLSSKSGGVNKKQSLQKKSQTFEKKAFSEIQYGQEYPTLADAAKVSQKEAKKQQQIIPFNPASTFVERNAFIQHSHQPVDENLLKAPLTRENYRRKFHQLLCCEEEEHETILRERCDGKYKFYLYQRNFSAETFWPRDSEEEYVRFGFLTADHLDGDKVAYAKQASEGIVNLQLCNSSRTKTIQIKADMLYTRRQNKKGEETIYLGFNGKNIAEIIKLYPSVSKTDGEVSYVLVKFVLKYSYFDRLHTAINNLPDTVLKRIMPDSASDFTPRDTAVHFTTSMIQCVREFVFLDQPRQIDDDHVPTPQKYALYRIINSDSSKAPVLVVGSFGTGKTRVLARAAYQILHNDNEAKVLICAHHQASADSLVENYFGKMIRAGWHWGKPLVRIIPNTRYHCNEEYQEYYKTARRLHSRNKQSPKLVVTTFLTSCHLLKYLGRNHFTHILLDEGAQTREPEIIAPLCLANEKTKIVIMGDHKQVGPSILVLGEKARENGLKYSLLERLYTIYSKEELVEASQTHCATLLTNFRSHHALLSLPSYLFYSSALMTVAEATTQLHPDAGHPLHFICSSLDQEVLEVSESSNRREIELILQNIKKFVDSWPKREWGKKKLSDICIMAATTNQKACFIEQLRSKAIKGVEVLTVYDIQGREFQAIFLSTAEPTDEYGSSKNPTKSPCGQYVFNTAITRAKSLVVCAGNPFLLMKIEKRMKNEQPNCWRDFIRRCMITKTFHVPSFPAAKYDGSVKESLQKLQSLVFSDNLSIVEVHEELHPEKKDPIITRYQKVVKKRYENYRLQIANDQRSIKKEDAPLEDDEQDDERVTVTCELVVKGARNAIAYPLNALDYGIAINGINHRRRTFEGDIVEVNVFGTNTETGQKYGEVVHLQEACHPTKYVCRADQYNIIIFYPIDKTVPAIVNLPKISKRMLQYNPEEFSQSQRAKYITVFEEESHDATGDDVGLRIKELIPIEIGPSLLFVVKVLRWLPKYRKPLGAVIEALPRTSNMFITEKLLRIANNIDTGDEIESIETIVTSSHDQSKQICRYDRAFTIDPPDAINLDDALSLVPVKENIYQLAVLIADVAKHIEKDSMLDKYAQRRGVSVYGLQNSLHMLPSDFSLKTPSLICGEIKDAIVITAEVKIEGGEVTEVVSCSSPENTTMKSMIKLCYKSAQQLLNSKTPETEEVQKRVKEFDSTGKLSISETLKLLFKIAMNIRIKRLGDAAYYYQISDPGEEEENWQSHLLVEELMIWANNIVAKYLYENLPQMSVLRRQLPPLAEESSAVEKAHEDVLCHSLRLKSLSSQSVDETPLLMTTSTLQAIQDACKRGDVFKLAGILTNDQLYPQLAIVHSALISISCRGEYICTRLIEDQSLYSHHSLRLRQYTHFTSPIRRYIDIVVQRLVNALINSSDITYSEDDLSRLCRHLNMKTKTAKRFEKDIKRVELASTCEDTLQKTQAYLTRSMTKQHRFELCFPSKKYNSVVMRDDTSFEQSQLNYSCREGSVIKWHVVSIPFSSPDFLLKNSEIADFEKDSESGSNGMYSSIQADVFHLMDSETDDDIKNKKRKKESFSAHVMDGMVRIDPDVWKLSHDCIKTPSEDNISKFIDKLPPVLSRLKAKSCSHYSKFSNSPIISYDITRSFGPGEVLNVWLGKSLRRPIASPGIHLIEIAPTVRVCLQHNQSPVMCFSDAQLQLTSKSHYRSESEYIELWSKALLAEASNYGVKTKTLVLFKDAPLVWPKLVQPDTCLDNIYFKPAAEDCLSLEIPVEKMDMMDFLKIQPGDLVCSRYDITNSSGEAVCAVYHFVIHGVKDVKNHLMEVIGIKLFMRPVGEHGCRVSERMRKELKDNPKCELQVIKMPESFNRLFHRLQCMEPKEDDIEEGQEQWSVLATEVALGTLSQQNMIHYNYSQGRHIMEKDRFARTLWDPKKNGIELNKTQQKAMKLALTNQFHLIQGPPGTGKSVTGAHLAYIFARANSSRPHNNQCVLYCGPSNKAVDVVHDEFNKLPCDKKLRILRLYGRTHERQDYPDPIYTLKLFEVEVLYRQEFEGDVLHHKIRNDDTNEIKQTKDDQEGMCRKRFKGDALHHKIRKGDKHEILKFEDDFRDMLKQGVMPSSVERKSYRDCITNAEKEELGKTYDIILCTCNETCSKRLLKLYGRVAQCIVDECGMANEPETLAAMGLCEHVVLIGDHMQLQPVVKYFAARECGLNISLFERYAERERQRRRDRHRQTQKQDCELLTRLDIQYRMHPFICKGPSELFYDGELEADILSVKNREPLKDSLLKFWPRRGHEYPVMFCNIVGEEEDMTDGKIYKRNVDTHSKSNHQEAKKALELIEVLLSDHKLDCKDIAVLTPYAAQEKLIVGLVKERDERLIALGGQELCQKKLMKEVTISSIIKSQGDEYKIVILSTVRSLPLSQIEDRKFVQPDQKWMRENLGFLTDSHQVNVGITRAKYGLIIIGNKVLLEYDKVWKDLIQKYEDNGCVVNEIIPISPTK